MAKAQMNHEGSDASAASVYVVAVVVVFFPDVRELMRQCAALSDQVAAIVWVNNGGADDLEAVAAACNPLVPCVLSMGGNAGVGTAQNAGVKWARQKGATHVLLMDQDSTPQSLMVQHLLNALGAFPVAAAAGPCYVDDRVSIGVSPFVQIKGLKTHRLPCNDAARVWEVDHLIASGCLISVSSLDQVGPMREDFFIDFIDVEWSLRARSKGHVVLGVCAAGLTHSLGDRHVYSLGKLRHVHSPLRLYYQVRNALWLYRLTHIPTGWKVVSAWRLFLKCAFYLLRVRPRRSYCYQMALGIWDGFLTSSSQVHTVPHSTSSHS